MSDALGCQTHDRVAVLEMRRGPANFFDARLLAEIADALEEFGTSGRIRAVVLCSAGRHFCAGADFGSASLDGDARPRAAAEIYRQGLRLIGSDVPVVAAIQGRAVGGGLGLACVADFRVASSTSMLHANFASLGFHHGFGLSVTLPRIVGHQKALDLLATARVVDGTEGASIGLVDRLVEPGEERSGALALATALAQQAPLAVRAMRRTLRDGLAERARPALDHELAEQERLWRTRDSALGLAAARDRAVPAFVGE